MPPISKRDAVNPLTAPVLTTLVPASAPLGAPSFTLHVIGTGFAETDVILWNGSAEPTTFVSATELTTGVNMSTAEVAITLPVAVQNAAGEVSNELAFALTAEGTLPEVDLPDGWLSVDDPWGRSVLLRVAEVVMIEERYEVSDSTGPLYGQSPHRPYRRITLSGGAERYLASGDLTPMLRELREG
jgi:hypothetical protein